MIGVSPATTNDSGIAYPPWFPWLVSGTLTGWGWEEDNPPEEPEPDSGSKSGLSPQSIYRKRIYILLTQMLAQLDAIVHWREEPPAPERPSRRARAQAKHVMEEWLNVIIAAGHLWVIPDISYDAEGYITIVWRKGKHELYLEITEDEIEYIQVWGINIHSQMDTGVLSRDHYLTLWEWLLDG